MNHYVETLLLEKNDVSRFFAGEINDHQAELGFPEKIAAHKTLINRLKQVSIDNQFLGADLYGRPIYNQQKTN